MVETAYTIMEKPYDGVRILYRRRLDGTFSYAITYQGRLRSFLSEIKNIEDCAILAKRALTEVMDEIEKTVPQ